MADYHAMLNRGEKHIVIVGPTGSGKTFLQEEIILDNKRNFRKTLLYTNRRMLTGQSHTVFEKSGIEHGIMAAGYKPDFLQDVQIASVQTVESRVYQRCSWEMYDADVVIIDEAHQFTGEVARKIIEDHKRRDAIVVGFTATPVDLGGIYTSLLLAGTKRELFKQGILVPVTTFAPDEPDMRKATKSASGEYAYEDVVKRVMVGEVIGKDGKGQKVYRPRIFGRVVEYWNKLNPEGRPTILFAPGVKESRWFAEEFAKEGISAAHIDADTDEEERERIKEGSASGAIKIVCNRFVLREGVNWPWLEHGIMATAVGAYSTYMQMVGRLMRQSDGKSKVMLQDHGGNIHRHGSANEDYPWTLDDTDTEIAKKKKEDHLRVERKDAEPIVCPECSHVRRHGNTCPSCGFSYDKSVRHVIQHNGKLKRIEEEVGQAGLEKRRATAEKRAWMGCVFAAYHSGQTFSQAFGNWRRKVEAATGKWPDWKTRYWPMPEGVPGSSGASPDWDRMVKRVHPDLGKRKENAT
jgi:superfamily II DNA or RNA helicase